MRELTSPFALLLFVAILYFIPSIIAKHREHQNVNGIFLLNLIAGWTVLGWLAALVMACGEIKPTADIQCSRRKLPLREEDQFCPRCGAELYG